MNSQRLLKRGAGAVSLRGVLLVLACLFVGGWIALELIPTPPKYGSFHPVDAAIRGVNGTEYSVLLDEQLVFRTVDGEEWVAPKGTYTDGASIPQLALSITEGRFDKKFREAAIVHDAYCQKVNAERCPEQYQSRTWQEVHDMFYEACLANGTPPMLAKMMWVAVYWGGPRWNDPASASQEDRVEAMEYGMAGCIEWIEENEAGFAALKKEAKQREQIQLKLYRNEVEISKALEAGREGEVRRKLREQQLILDREAKARPNDLMLRNFQGHTRKNRALLFEKENQPERAASELLEAEKDFLFVVGKRAKDSSALDGLGDLSEIQLKEGRFGHAERLNKEVLKKMPEKEAALERKRRIEKGR